MHICILSYCFARKRADLEKFANTYPEAYQPKYLSKVFLKSESLSRFSIKEKRLKDQPLICRDLAESSS